MMLNAAGPSNLYNVKVYITSRYGKLWAGVWQYDDRYKSCIAAVTSSERINTEGIGK